MHEDDIDDELPPCIGERIRHHLAEQFHKAFREEPQPAATGTTPNESNEP